MHRNICKKMRFNTQTKIFGLIFSVALLIIGGCKRDGSEQIKVIDIKKEFSIQPWEILKESGSEYGFLIASTEKKCDGTKIRIVPLVSQSDVSINLQAFINPDSCFNTTDVVRDTTKLGLLSNGSYALQINLKDVVLNSGTLSVSDTKLSVQMQSTDGITIPVTDILRVPQGTIWGTIKYNTDQENLVTAFSDSLKTYAHNFSLVNGNYGYFQFIDNSYTPNPTATTTTFTKQKTYFMRLDKPLKSLTNLIQNTKTQLGKNGNLWIMAYNGVTF